MIPRLTALMLNLSPWVMLLPEFDADWYWRHQQLHSYPNIPAIPGHLDVISRS